MSIKIAPAVWQSFPDMRLVVAVVENVDNRCQRPAVAARLARTQEQLRQDWGYPNAQSHPRVAAWRRAFKSLGISAKKHVSSIEALCRRALSGKDLPLINPLVDFYNSVSLQYRVPAGGWDLDDLADGRVVLGFSSGGELFRELGREEVIEVGSDELSYTDGNEVITRHFVWRQSERGKIAPASERVFLVSEILSEVEAGVERQVEEALAEGLAEHFGVTPRTAVLSAPTTSW